MPGSGSGSGSGGGSGSGSGSCSGGPTYQWQTTQIGSDTLTRLVHISGDDPLGLTTGNKVQFKGTKNWDCRCEMEMRAYEPELFPASLRDTPSAINCTPCLKPVGSGSKDCNGPDAAAIVASRIGKCLRLTWGRVSKFGAVFLSHFFDEGYFGGGFESGDYITTLHPVTASAGGYNYVEDPCTPLAFPFYQWRMIASSGGPSGCGECGYMWLNAPYMYIPTGWGPDVTHWAVQYTPVFDLCTTWPPPHPPIVGESCPECGPMCDPINTCSTPAPFMYDVVSLWMTTDYMRHKICEILAQWVDCPCTNC